MAYLSFPDRKIYVNRKWCTLLRLDKDLQYLLKKNKIKLKRDGQPRCRHSYVVKV